MRQRTIMILIVAAFAAASISGCGTVPKKTRQEISDIKSRVETLETKVESVEARQAEMARTMTEPQAAASAGEEAMLQPGTNISVKPRMTAAGKARTKDIQICLKNAGFYTGKIDGVKGRQTRKAIREFQAANGLKTDGVVGSKTWAALSRYAEGAATKEGVEK